MPKWYRDWLLNQKWFKQDTKINRSPYHRLKGWDGHSSKGQAAYDAIFEMEMQEGINSGLECICGCPKYSIDKYCEGDFCKHS